VLIRGIALTFASVSVAAETRASEPLSGNGLFRLSGVMTQYSDKCSEGIDLDHFYVPSPLNLFITRYTTMFYDAGMF
jgi:hypothetical protein